MIQLNVLNPKGLNNASKPSAKGMEESSAFIDFLKQISGNEGEKEKKDEQLSPVFSFITLPLEQPPLETAPTVTELPGTDESAIKLQNKLHSASDSSSFAVLNTPNKDFLLGFDKQPGAKQIEPMFISIPLESEQSIANKPSSIIQDSIKLITIMTDPSVVAKLQENSQEPPEQMDSFDKSLLNMLDGKEHQPMPAPQSANLGTIVNPPAVNKDQTEGGAFEMPVRADHLAKDVTKVLSTAIDVQKMNDKIEASFSLKPEHLGKVDVKVSIHDGNVTAEFFASTPLGKDILETQVHALRTALEQQGFQVQKIDISQQSQNFSGPFSQQKGDSHARQGQQDSKKRNGQAVYPKEDEYRDYAVESSLVSQINTTA